MWKNIGLIFGGSVFVFTAVQSMMTMQRVSVQAFDSFTEYYIMSTKNDLIFAIGLTLLIIGIIQEMKA